ncbi:MAG TPA: glutamate 5-kinase [Actinomycetota bacterium]|nr:glutamate 5-kinase [Actinomycetota bacterium]
MTRPVLGPKDRLVLKIGTSSLAGPDGEPDDQRIATLVDGIQAARAEDIEVVLVSSGAIAAGLRPLGLTVRPTDIPTLQAAAAVGQGILLQLYARAFAGKDVTAAQLLLTRYDFMHRGQYLNARNTLDRLLALGVLPIVNENDTVAVDEIRFGDNDRLAALVANLGRAKLLLLLTDARGVHSVDPRKDPDAPVIDEVDRITPELEKIAGNSGSELGSGGMSSKIAAAWVATFSGAGVVVAGASEPDVIPRIARGERIGTYFHPHPHHTSARRLWIAFAQPPKGTVVVDDGARAAVVLRKTSLLPVGVVAVEGRFAPGDTVDVAVRAGGVFARGLVRYSSDELSEARGSRTSELARREVIHRDELMVLEGTETE